MKGRTVFITLLLSLCLVFVGFGPVFAQVQVGVQTATTDVLSTSNSNSGASAGSYLIQESTQQNIQNTPFFPLPVPLIQGGRVGDVTDQLPNFAGMKKLRLPYIKENGERHVVDPGESVNPEKMASFYGHLFNRITLQDIWIDIAKDWNKMVEKGWDPCKMRYRVYYKDRAKGMGVNLGGSGGASGFNGSTAVQGSGGGIFGYSSSTADPVYIVMICEIVE